MYNSSDPRENLKSSGGVATAIDPQVHPGFAAAEYVHFQQHAPQDTSSSARTWYGRGQNFVVAYSETDAGAVLARANQPDEYFLLLPDPATRAVIKTAGESRNVSGYSIVIVPPGDSTIEVSGGVVVRVFTSRADDLARRSLNAASYARPHPFIPPFQPGPEPPSGYRIRVYSLDVPPQEKRFGRIWRCSGLMINVLPQEHGRRDVTRLSPHHHEDFEQCSLALEGAFTHHIRWPWTANSHHWRADDHEHCPAPSMAVIPPPAIHTSAATEPGINQLVDIFSPPRIDFSKMAGWVLNADEYPMP
jgi:hypothetical protein